MSAHRNDVWTPTYLPRFTATDELPYLRWWYRLTAPHEPPHTIGFRAQEFLRQARLLSSIVLAEIILLVVIVICTMIGEQYSVAFSLCVILGMLCLALWLNRQGNRQSASLLVVIVSELSVIITLTLEGWFFNNSTISNFGLSYLLIPEIIAALLLSMRSVFVLVALHSVFTTIMVFYLPHHVHWPLHTSVGMVLGATGIFLLVACIALLWRRSMAFLIAHADGIEVVAALEHTMAEQEHTTAQHKRELDLSVHRLMQTHLRVANGEYDVRVPIKEDDVLWPIAGSLNTLLARIQRLGRLAAKLEKTEQEAARLAAALRALRMGDTPIPLQRSGTAIDLVLIELSTALERPVETAVEHNE